MRSRWMVVSLLSVAMFAACSTVRVGSEFDLRTFESKVQRGATTQAQVRGWLGAPIGTGIHVDTGGERYDEWTYYYGKGTLPDMANAEFNILQIKFDKNGVVRGYNWSGGK